MKAKSIISHLKPYSIFKKRRTTIAHAFASALASTDIYDEEKVALALQALGQNPDNLHCVYCCQPAQSWDHLFNLVRGENRTGTVIKLVIWYLAVATAIPRREGSLLRCTSTVLSD